MAIMEKIKGFVGKIDFGILSTERICQISTVKVTNPQAEGTASLSDRKMGVLNFGETCLTCGEQVLKCPNHFGYIDLHTCVIHPLMFRYVVGFLKCFCVNCKKLKFSKGELQNTFQKKTRADERLVELGKLSEKNRVCAVCGMKQPKFQVTINPINKNSAVTMIYTTKTNKITTKSIVPLTAFEIKSVFENLALDDLRKIGINLNVSHPKDFIISYLPVIPPSARPYALSDGVLHDDDLTIVYNEILKMISFFEKQPNGQDGTSPEYHMKLLKLQTFIYTLMDNAQHKQKNTMLKFIKGIRERLRGKTGTIRLYCSGKRVNNSARTPIGGTQNVSVDEIIIPEFVANILVVPIKVTKGNISEVQEILDKTDLIKTIYKYNPIEKEAHRCSTLVLCHERATLLKGDKIIRNGLPLKFEDKLQFGDMILRNNPWDKSLLLIPAFKKKRHELRIGDIVKRSLLDGDYVLFNRQPTLHTGSMIAMKVKIAPGKTFRFSLALTKTFNADFDGDEMNLHATQTPEAIVELSFLTMQTSPVNLQSGKIVPTLVQDTVLSMYELTNIETRFTVPAFERLAHKIVDSPAQYIEKKKSFLKTCPEELWYSGRGLFSLLIPAGFQYRSPNGAVVIENGILVSGRLTKDILGQSFTSLTSQIYWVFGNRHLVNFLNKIQLLASEFLMYERYFSVGYKDCLISDKTKRQIHESSLNLLIKANSLLIQTKKHENEARICATLNELAELGKSIAKKNLGNNLCKMIDSGSKGSYVNVTQLMASVGQQNIFHGRPLRTMTHKTRCLPYFEPQYDEVPLKEDEISNEQLQKKFLSRGFVFHSYIEGLTPQEYFFHAQSGRIGLIDTAIKTAETGYLQRKMVKGLEDHVYCYDGTIRNSANKIIQFVFNQCGFLPGREINRVNFSPLNLSGKLKSYPV